MERSSKAGCAQIRAKRAVPLRRQKHIERLRSAIEADGWKDQRSGCALNVDQSEARLRLLIEFVVDVVAVAKTLARIIDQENAITDRCAQMMGPERK